MFWYILLGFLIILTIIGIIMSHIKCKSVKRYQIMGVGVWIKWISVSILLCLGLTTTVIVLYYKKEISVFKQQKYYIEQVAPTLSQSDNYTLTQKRIELNQWLYEMKYRKQTYGIFTLAPDEILELEEIR